MYHIKISFLGTEFGILKKKINKLKYICFLIKEHWVGLRGQLASLAPPWSHNFMGVGISYLLFLRIT